MPLKLAFGSAQLLRQLDRLGCLLPHVLLMPLYGLVGILHRPWATPGGSASQRIGGCAVSSGVLLSEDQLVTAIVGFTHCCCSHHRLCH
jgi:hypothetical protein